METIANIIAIAAVSLGMYLWLTDLWWPAGFCFALAILTRSSAMYYRGLR